MKTKRFLSILLSLVLVLGMLPGMSLTAFADDNSTTTITPGTDDAKTGTGQMTITLKIKAAQTITADNVTATYGDTDKSVSASVTTPSTGGGTISYAVKEGSGDYISIASDGKLTIKKVPPTDGKAYVIVTAAATDDYAETTKEVTVTISKAEATVTALNQSIMVGGTVPELSAPVLDTHYSVTGLVGEDTLMTAPTLTYQKNGSAATPDSATAGTYDIVPSGASAGDNYNISYTNGTLTITAKDTQTITASDVTATYGDTNKSVSATTDGNGEISYAVKTGSENYIDVNASTGALTIKAVPADGKAYVTVTAAETTTGGTGGNGYAAATKDVTVNISKAIVTITAKDQSIYVGGTVPTLSGADFYTVTGLVGTDTLTTNPTLAYQKDGSAANPDNTAAGTYDIVPSGAVASDNYTISYTNGTLTISNKGVQTITAENVTVTYGDTGKNVNATVTDPTEGGGAISYAVKEGSGDYIEVDATTGALTIKKVPADGKAYVTVTAAGTATYEQATKDVTVTIEKADAAAATVTANSRNYDGTDQPLVTVTGEAVGGEMQYAIGTATEATGTYAKDIPTATDAGTYYVWYKVVGDENHKDTAPAYVTTVIKGQISATVTFKVVNGSWNDGEGGAATSDRTVVLTGKEGDVLKLTADQIPAAGEKPADGYKTGAWNVTPSTEVEIKEDTTFIYTYLEKAGISATVTFKVVNGSWNNGEGEAATADRIVILTGKEGDALKLTADQIPAVGEKPADGYKAGAWDVTPNTEIEITQDTTYTYTYVGKETISKTVTFKVVNGSWNDGEGEAATADRIVILTGKEGDVLKLTAEQIPAVGAKPGEGYQAGAWDVTPSTETEIKENTTFIYTYAAQKGKSISYTTYEGEGGEYKHGSDGTLTFVFKRSENDSETFARFTGLKYDGRSLTRDKDYRARTGSVIITLDHELLESMTAGNHILTAVFDDGEADAHFTVIANAEPTATPTATPTVTPEPTVTPTAAPTATPTPTPTPKPVPKTGDNSNPALWLAMMILGILCIGGVVFRTVRKRG